MGIFIIKKTPSGAFNFSLLAANKQKIAVASQVYTTKASCKTGMASVGKNAAKCIAEDRIEDKTLKNTEPKTCPKFEVFTDKAGKARFRLKARNGEVILSSQGYASKQNCLAGIDSVKANAAESAISEIA